MIKYSPSETETTFPEERAEVEVRSHYLSLFHDV